MSAPVGSPSRPLPSSRSRNLTDLAAALLAAAAFLLLAALVASPDPAMAQGHRHGDFGNFGSLGRSLLGG